LSPEFEKIRREINRVTRDFTADDWLRAPRGKWNSAQILEHLLLTYKGTTKSLLKAMEAGRPLGSAPTLREKAATFVVTGLGILPTGGIAHKQATPTIGSAPGSLRPFNDALVAMDASLMDAEKRFGAKVKLLDHPFIGPLNAQQWRRFHRIHAMHHLKQISQRSKSGK